MGFFESFSAPFMMSVALWPLVSFIVTVPVLAMLYHRDNRLGFGAALSAYATVLYLIGLLCFTLYPMPDDPAAYCATHHLHPQLNPLQFIGDIRADGLTAILQIVMNVVFFVPLGFIMKRVFRWKFAVALPVGFLASLLVETMQLTGVMGVFPCSYRLFDVDDLIWNTSGAVIGYGCAMLFDRLFPPRRTDMQTVTRPGFVRRFVAFLIDMGLVVVCATPVGVAAMVLVTMVSGRPGADVQRMRLLGPLGFGDIAILVMLVLFEWVIPWFRQGRTLGGSYTHMTCETTPRSGARRVAFYAARFAAICCVVFCGRVPWAGTVILVMGVFWLVRRQMPYDLI